MKRCWPNNKAHPRDASGPCTPGSCRATPPVKRIAAPAMLPRSILVLNCLIVRGTRQIQRVIIVRAYVMGNVGS